ncbi:tryptophan ABC transporter substrate-binding protein [Xylocopilactobacillus apis]|uniref:ABC transporter substrate-binding protein n=1 Tax=Xylocopilactobacillus apis TaxID=2932183 RepID=A0AAU9D3A8_9LACO|nr:tryptophan ABC transporter substrate-binding protein [Xylocopilactobacillus apis]BDR55885.1 ABC transporter substrate-binding protein [Xylocopilactobacillus apis]
MKRMLALIGVLLVFLGFAFFNEGGSTKAGSMPRVGVLTLMHHPALDQIQEGFTKGMKEEGYVDGKNVKIDYQNAQGDQSNLKTMATKLVNENSEVLFGITTPASQSLANLTKKIPIVMGAVTDPRSAGLVTNYEHPGSNITGVSNMSPIKDQLKLIKEFMPDLKTLGVIYTSSDSSATAEYKQIVKTAKEMKVPIKVYSISNSNDLNQVSQEMLQKVDAVMVPQDNVIAGAMQTLVKNADAVNKPIFPAVDTMVKQGGVAAYGINQYKLGLLGGHLTASILKGKNKPSTTAIRYIKHGEAVLNLKQAQKLGIKIPARFLEEAQKEGKVFK